jgi:hypothetical protein
VHDYLVHIKRDMGGHLIKHLWRITLVFACLGHDLYTVANIQNLHVLTYHREERRLPLADIVRNDVGLFSEEAGEVTFSLLARSTLGDSVEDKHARLKDCFLAIGAMRNIRMDEIEDGVQDDQPNVRTTISPSGQEVVALEQHFLGVLRSLQHGSFSYYSSNDALKRGIRFKIPWKQAPSKQLLFEPQTHLSRVWHKVAGLDRDWGQQFAERFASGEPLEPVSAAEPDHEGFSVPLQSSPLPNVPPISDKHNRNAQVTRMVREDCLSGSSSPPSSGT